MAEKLSTELRPTSRMTDSGLLKMISDYTSEAKSVWGEGLDGQHTIEESWTLSKRMFYGDQLSSPIAGIENPILNRTQNSIIANTAAQTQITPTIQFTPTSSQGGTTFVMSENGSQFLQMDTSGKYVEGVGVVDQHTRETLLNMEQVLGEALIPELLGRMLVAGDHVKQEYLLACNTTIAAELLQRAYDGEWSQMRGNKYFRDNVLQNNVFGHQPMFYQWDREKSQGVLENPPIKTVLPDPIQSNIEKFRFLIFNFIVSEEEAIDRYPEHEKAIKEAGITGQFDGGSMGGLGVSPAPFSWSNTQFNRNMVPITILWRRFVRFPMTAKEAIRFGKVDLDENKQYRLPGEGGILGNGEVTEPGSKNWPTISHIEEIHAIPSMDKVLRRQRCAYKDMPMAWNRNIHMIDRPYGISECVRLFHIQRVINLLFRSIVGIIEQYQFPPEVLPLSVYERMQKMGKDTRRVARRTMYFSDEELRELVPALQHLASWAPPMPASYITMLQLALGEHDRLSGDVDVLQGDTPAGVSSGVAIQQLQATARGPLGFKSRDAEETLERIADLHVDAMIRWMSPFHWEKYSNGYPRAGMRRLLEILDDREVTIRAEISSGRAINTEASKREAFEARRQGALSQRSFLDITKVAPGSSDQEIQRMLDERAVQMAEQLKAQQAQAGPAAAPQGRGGNGQQQVGTPAEARL